MPAVVFHGYLDLQEKNIISLDGLHEIPNISQVSFLDLEGNKLTELQPGRFANLPSLRFVNLMRNDFSEQEKAHIREEAHASAPNVMVTF